MCQNFLGDTLCHVATWKSHVATSKFHLSATSRRGFFTSRRHFNTPLSRRDVYCHVATWNSHVTTWNSHVATWNSHVVTSLLHVATSFSHLLCHVATLPRTSRRQLVMLSATSRRHPARRDVALFLTQEWFILQLHRTPLSSETLAPSRTVRALPCRRPLPCSPTTVSHPLWQVLGHSGISTTVCPILAWVQ